MNAHKVVIIMEMFWDVESGGKDRLRHLVYYCVVLHTATRWRARFETCQVRPNVVLGIRVKGQTL